MVNTLTKGVCLRGSYMGYTPGTGTNGNLANCVGQWATKVGWTPECIMFSGGIGGTGYDGANGTIAKLVNVTQFVMLQFPLIPNGTGGTYADVYNGNFDSTLYIPLANALKANKSPQFPNSNRAVDGSLMIVLSWEIFLDSVSTQQITGSGGNTISEFKKAWRHAVEVLRANGVTCIIGLDGYDAGAPDASTWFPGTSWVSATTGLTVQGCGALGYHCYNGTVQPASNYTSMADMLSKVVGPGLDRLYAFCRTNNIFAFHSELADQYVPGNNFHFNNVTSADDFVYWQFIRSKFAANADVGSAFALFNQQVGTQEDNQVLFCGTGSASTANPGAPSPGVNNSLTGPWELTLSTHHDPNAFINTFNTPVVFTGTGGGGGTTPTTLPSPITAIHRHKRRISRLGF